MPSNRILTAAPAIAAAFALLASPAEATEIAIASAAHSYAPQAAWGEGADTYQNHRRYRHWRHRHRGVDAGDVIAGVLILGGIAAIADAATRDRDERYRARDRGYPPPPTDYRRGDYRYDGARGIDGAVSLCVDAIERDARIDTVDGADRYADGWRVSGSLYDGARFICSIGADGRIDDIDYGPRDDSYANEPDGTAPYDDDRSYGAGYEPQEDRQYDDDRYAAAWAEHDGRAPIPADTTAPDYPGGPLEDAPPPAEGDLEIGTGYPGAD